MSSLEQIYKQIVKILDDLSRGLLSVAERDDHISDTEKVFLEFVNSRISPIKQELDHVFHDNDVTDDEKKILYNHLGDLLNDAIALTRDDDRIDEGEIFLITKLKVELTSIIKSLRDI
ncbi:MAG: hypothetical protein ACXAE3_04390 [Candidatus Kariarchaeaceae archaeon]|jgi:hypothetical protein